MCAHEETLTKAFDTVEDGIEALRNGQPVIVTDDETRENEGDLIIPAARITPEVVNRMIRDCSGIICVPMLVPQLNRLGIQRMVAENREVQRTDFTVSVDAAQGITTGISAYDRYETIKTLADPAATSDMLVQPGHVFPLRAQPGGVLQRAGHTEAAVDLAVLAGQPPVGVICELMNEDGSVMRLPQLVEYKRKHGLKLISIAALIEFRHKREKLVEQVADVPFASDFGEFRLKIFRSNVDGRQHYALFKGELDDRPTLVRVHSENILADLFRSTEGRGYHALRASLEQVAEAGHGVVVYIEQPSGGLSIDPSGGAVGRVRPVKMDFRDYGIGAQILKQLGLKRIRLMSSSSQPRVVGLDGFDLEIVEMVPTQSGPRSASSAEPASDE